MKSGNEELIINLADYNSKRKNFLDEQVLNEVGDNSLPKTKFSPKISQSEVQYEDLTAQKNKSNLANSNSKLMVRLSDAYYSNQVADESPPQKRSNSPNQIKDPSGDYSTHKNKDLESFDGQVKFRKDQNSDITKKFYSSGKSQFKPVEFNIDLN